MLELSHTVSLSDKKGDHLPVLDLGDYFNVSELSQSGTYGVLHICAINNNDGYFSLSFTEFEFYKLSEFWSMSQCQVLGQRRGFHPFLLRKKIFVEFKFRKHLVTDSLESALRTTWVIQQMKWEITSHIWTWYSLRNRPISQQQSHR